MANNVPEIEKIIRKQLADLNRLRDRVLPVKVGRAVMESTRQNFREGGFYGREWKDTKRRTIGFADADGRYSPLLSRQNHLMSSTDYVPGNGRVTIQNKVEYAQIHNEGGHIPVTVKMKRFFWAKYYSAGANSQLYGGKNKQKADAFAGESGFWKGMALKKVGSMIRIPRRQFLGDSPQVEKIIEDITKKELQNYINGINNRTSRETHR